VEFDDGPMPMDFREKEPRVLNIRVMVTFLQNNHIMNRIASPISIFERKEKGKS